MPRRTAINPPAVVALLLMGLLVLGCGGTLTGCAGRSAGLNSNAQGLPLTDMGPAGETFLLAQTLPAEADDPFADPTEEEEARFLEELGEEAPLTLVADPLEPWNRFMFQVNDRLYFWLLKPVAQGYRWVLPAGARRGIKNFFYNLGTPVRLVNNLLQGRAKAAGAELGRFVVNSTEGILGFGDPASRYPELVIPMEDLGQTFGSYGIGNGFYLVWPLLGPATLRDTVGLVGDAFMDPVSIFNIVETEVWLGIRGVDVVNETSFRIGDYETLKEAALDPYGALRNGYIQRRNRLIQE
ncbi:MAG: VacJ family lipoprotein [Desulfobacterales bacterium]